MSRRASKRLSHLRKGQPGCEDHLLSLIGLCQLLVDLVHTSRCKTRHDADCEGVDDILGWEVRHEIQPGDSEHGTDATADHRDQLILHGASRLAADTDEIGDHRDCCHTSDSKVHTELDVDAYPQLKANLESVKTKIEDLFKKMGSQETIKNNLRASMRKRNELLACDFSAYESEVKAINESQPELSVELTFKGDKDAFRELLKNAFRGSNLKDAKRQMLSENFTDFLALVDDIILDDGKKCKAILSENEFGKVKEKILSQYGELIRKLTPNKVEIKYHGKLLKQHSLGQRASALVLFILTKSENDVIIIDQPEDDLDNKVIYDEVIKAIRDKKTDIQFIFATHNANIPVLGDAEKIVAAEYSEGKILPIQGNIDSPATHKLIVDIMEGGQEAFERRQMIYTAWN